MTKVLWRQYKSYSGCLIRGVAPIVIHDPSKHMSCAAWLTSEAEGPSYGYVQSYDGAGISAGLLHNVLVLPRDLSQGDLGALVRRMLAVLDISVVGSASPAGAFLNELKRKGWTLAPDGKFRDSDGRLVSGADLRNWASPRDGVVPTSGADWEQASRIATIFHDLFADQRTWKIQEDFAISWLARGNRNDELMVYRTFARIHDLDSFVDLPVKVLPPSVHVAMCVYHSFSANSPKVAGECLARASAKHSSAEADGFAKNLISELGLHGRDAWRDEPGDGSNRYDRTRVALWGHEALFPGCRDVMPRDLP